MKKYTYTAGYRTFVIEADNKKQAIEKARKRHFPHSVNVSSFMVKRG